VLQRAPQPANAQSNARDLMNAIFFGCKRAFHSCMRIGRQALRGFGLTPARFDMLTAIGVDRWYSRTQSALRVDLGVSAPTVSRMVRSLEELGLVERRKEQYGDRRQLRVRLTELGLRCLRKATRLLIGTGAIQLAVDCALTEDRPYDDALCLAEMDLTEAIFFRIRRAFGDVATLHYPWHPDD
jgi:DNA-binding MarR family transcriptional regulator